MPIKFKVIIRSMTPYRTATPPPGEDTPWRGIRATQCGKTIAQVSQAYRCKIHENKKNGGLAYTAWFSLEFTLASSEPVTISYIILNAAHGDDTLVYGMLDSFQSQGIKYNSDLRPSPDTPKLQISPSFESSIISLADAATKGLVNIIRNRVTQLLTNQDGPVLFKTVQVPNPIAMDINEQMDISASCAGMRGRSHYHADVVLIRIA